MKKLTSLHILMLMGLAVGSGKINCQEDLQEQAVQLALKSEQTESLNDEVLQNLAEISPETISELLIEEDEIEVSIATIKKFVDKKNKEIEELRKQQEVDGNDIAKIAAQLADVQAKLEKAIAIERAKNKKPHKFEQAVKDNLKKAEQALKKLNAEVTKKAKTVKDYIVNSNYVQNKKDYFASINNTGKALGKGNFSQAGKNLQKSAKQWASNPWRTPDKKAQTQQSAQAMPDNEMMDEEVAIQSMATNSSKKSKLKKASSKK